MKSSRLRYLLFMRHATAQSADGVRQDFDRPLSSEGLAEAARMATHLSRLPDSLPFTVYCSEALRARQTFAKLSEHGKLVESVHFESLYYQGSAEQVLQTLATVDEQTSSLLVIGHNPTWSQIVSYLSGSVVSLSPANAVLLSRKVDSWSMGLSAPGWTCEKIIKP